MEKIPKKGYPTIADDYMLYEEVGEGVSAVVYKALCIPLNETVAIKILDLESNKHGLDSVRREVQIMSLIDHPNLLRAYCSFMVGSKLWIVLPYMAGGSFFHIMKSTHPEGFEQSVIATVLRQVIKALAYLHAHGNIHRDVKAGNVLLDSKGTVKLADFGVSASLFDAGDRERPRNSFVGTPCWMAPEVMQQVHGYDYKADIWSFGITALELAHGHAPFSKYPPMKVLLMTLQNAPPGLDYKRDKRFTKSFKELVAACLVKDPRKRPTAGKLLTHRFFKHARSHEYLAKAIFDDICPLGDRFKMLQAQEFGGEEQQSQMQYLRGISAWNFDLEDMMKQIQECDSISSMDDPSFSGKRKNSFFNLFALSERPSMEHLNKFTYTESENSEEALKDVKDIGSSSAPVLTYQSAANEDQLSVNQKTDNNASPSVKNISDELCFQQQEQLKDTGIVISHKDEPYNFVVPFAGLSVNAIPSTVSMTLSSLQCILQQNTMQREQIHRLISYVDGSIEPEEALRKDLLFQTSSTATRENMLQILVTSMEESVRKLDDDLRVQKMKNYQLEKQMNQYLRKD